VSVLAWAGVAALGGLGALLRFLLDGAVTGRAGRDLPFGTLAVNLTGAFLLGLLTGVSLRGDALVLAGGATLGSFTTFSTWMFETQRLAEEGEGAGAAGNAAISLAVGLGAVALGRLIGSHL
jgi:fluoride exporter